MSAGAGTPVVAAVCLRGDRYLVAQRPGHKRHGGLWEFPGGKVHDGEDLAAAVRRELAEELELAVTGVGDALFEAADPRSPFRIIFVPVETEGDPVPHEHDQVRWCAPAELARLPMAPADAAFVTWLARR